jgi:hypothetical protein
VGSLQATLIVDFSPGGSCNIVTEDSAFIFDEGTIVVHSDHEDCATHGLRIDPTFHGPRRQRRLPGRNRERPRVLRSRVHCRHLQRNDHLPADSKESSLPPAERWRFGRFRTVALRGQSNDASWTIG